MKPAYSIDFHPEVESEYNNAYHWYELQQAGLGDRFLLKIREKLDQISEFPEGYGAKGSKKYREEK